MRNSFVVQVNNAIKKDDIDRLLAMKSKQLVQLKRLEAQIQVINDRLKKLNEARQLIIDNRIKNQREGSK